MQKGDDKIGAGAGGSNILPQRVFTEPGAAGPALGGGEGGRVDLVMSNHCSHCGAVFSEESTCQTLHEELLSFEALNAVAHSIHFLHVTCFLVQHEHYSDEALVWAEAMLRIHLDEHLTEQQLLHALREDGKQQASHLRPWKFHRSADARPLPKVAWPVTIVDVAQHLPNAEVYGERVKQWARATLQHMPALFPHKKQG